MNYLLKRFSAYLKDVITFYNENGSLSGFSKITEKHHITAIPQELFFKFRLDQLPSNTFPNEELCNSILDAIRVRKSKHRRGSEACPFTAGRIIAWQHPNGLKSIACLTKDEWASFVLNMRGREDEKDRIWVCDNLPYEVLDGTLPLVEPTLKEMKRFTFLICKEYEQFVDYYTKHGKDE